MPISPRNKADFDTWISGVINDLNLQVNEKRVSANKLRPRHWKRIGEIYDKCRVQESRIRTKDHPLVWEGAVKEATAVLIEANGENSEVILDGLIDNYLNS
jgi:hypothetical protein